MASPDNIRDQFRRVTEQWETATSHSGTPIDHGSGGPHDPGMESRVTRLEVIAEHTEKRLDRIEAQNGQILTVLGDVREKIAALPTRSDLKSSTDSVRTSVSSALGIGFAVAFGALAVFIAILAYLQDQRISQAPQPPQVILMPAPQMAPPPPPQQ